MKRLLIAMAASLLTAHATPARGANAASLSLPPDGGEDVVDYERYGEFHGRGTASYRYEVSNLPALSQAVGAGLYPNRTSLDRHPTYKVLQREGKLEGDLASFSPELDPALAFYKWGSLKGTPHQGLRMYNVARSLELAGEPKRALKAYYAIVVHFPREVAWVGGRLWYVGVAALDAVERLVDAHPDWNLSLREASIEVQNGFDRKATNDVFVVDPGRWSGAPDAVAADPEMGLVRQSVGDGSIRLQQRDNGHWQLMEGDRPLLIRGISYVPTPVGSSPDFGFYKPHTDWMDADTNGNDRIDAPYETWVDANGNNRRDAGEPVIGDFELLQSMGVNAIRLYHQATNKALLRDLSSRYGIRVLMGNLVGAYAMDSGAAWEDGTDYTDPHQRDKIRDSVRRMVLEHKDEEYVLMWVLGNENNYGQGNNADRQPAAYYKFVNSLARMIHILDPSRPVALCNGDLEYLDLIAREAGDVDVLAVNAYRGEHGMGKSFWTALQRVWRKPVLISEFGCPAYSSRHGRADVERRQAAYLLSAWNDIASNGAGRGAGLAIGGVVFEWVDEWWKAGTQYEAWVQDERPQSKGPFPDGQMYEEWLGVASQGNGESSPFLRRLRPAYFQLRSAWAAPMRFSSNPRLSVPGGSPDASE